MAKTSDTHTAIVRRDGRWWLVDVPELDVTGQARTVAEAESVAREIIGLVLDKNADTVAVSLVVEMPAEARQAWEESKAREITAQASSQEAARLARQAVQMLRADGFTFRDAGVALGISPQRVQQLAKAA